MEQPLEEGVQRPGVLGPGLTTRSVTLNLNFLVCKRGLE